jgi:hypothetical protein
MKRFLHLKEELVTLSKYFLPLLFRDYNYRTGGQPIPTVIFYLVITIGVLVSFYILNQL